MVAFPILKTGATVQYPLQTSTRFATEQVLFLDGTRQTYSLAAALRRWTINLAMLDAAEAAAVSNFVEEQQGGTFSFTDPVTGSNAQRCVVRGLFDAEVGVDLRTRVQLVIEEVL